MWGFSRTALWSTPKLPPGAIRVVLVCGPEAKQRMEAFCCTALQATPAQILQWIIMRWAVEGTFEEARAPLGLEPQRHWAAQAIARTTPVLLGPVCAGPWHSPAAESRGAASRGGNGLVPQSRANLCGLSGAGTSTSLACPLLRERYLCRCVYALAA